MNAETSGRYATLFITLITAASWAFIAHVLTQAMVAPGIV